jgi:hypothetical protein
MAREERTTGAAGEIAESFQRLSEQTAQLVREELELLRGEMTEKGREAAPAAGMVAAAGALGVGAFAVATAGVVSMFSRVMPRTLACFFVAGGYAAGAAALAARGQEQLRAVEPLPKRTVASVKEDVQAASDAVGSA